LGLAQNDIRAHALIEKGLRRGVIFAVQVDPIRAHALIEKGLRRLSRTTRDSIGPIRAHALIEKGLRPVEVEMLKSIGHSSPRPDREGIKTGRDRRILCRQEKFEPTP